jgi:ABC-type Fe3+-siderophore transport system permease subunit
MRALALLMVASIVALCAGAARTEAEEPVSAVLRTPKGYRIVWNESKAYFTLELPGQDLKPSNLEGFAFFVDGKLIQILAVELGDFAAGETSAKAILDRHMQYELNHWKGTLGMPMPTTVHAQGPSQEKAYLLWEIRWPEQVVQKTKAKGGMLAIKQLFLTALAGDRVVVVSRTVLEGEDEGAALQYVQAVANTLVVKDARIDIEAVQRQIRGEP